MAFFEESTFYWDIAAATLIAQESGCSVSSEIASFYDADPHVRGCIVARTDKILSQLKLLLEAANLDR